MDEKSLKGKIVGLRVVTNGWAKIPTFRVKLEDGSIRDFARGDVSTESFGKNYDLKTADQMAKHSKKKFFGLKVGDTIYISQQRNY